MKKLATTNQAAKIAKISRATVQNWIKGSRISAPALQVVGGRAVRLWGEKDIEGLRKLRGTIKKGPPKRKRHEPGGSNRRQRG